MVFQGTLEKEADGSLFIRVPVPNDQQRRAAELFHGRNEFSPLEVEVDITVSRFQSQREEP